MVYHEKSEASKCLALCVQCRHLILQFLCLGFCDGWLVYVIIVIIKYAREHFLNFLSVIFPIRVGVFSCIDYFCQQLVFQTVTLSVAANDATYLPETDIIQELMTANSYLANEQFKQIVGG